MAQILIMNEEGVVLAEGDGTNCDEMFKKAYLAKHNYLVCEAIRDNGKMFGFILTDVPPEMGM
jgi:hypothetical protein